MVVECDGVLVGAGGVYRGRVLGRLVLVGHYPLECVGAEAHVGDVSVALLVLARLSYRGVALCGYPRALAAHGEVGGEHRVVFTDLAVFAYRRNGRHGVVNVHVVGGGTALLHLIVAGVLELEGHLNIPAEDVFTKGKSVDADVLLRPFGGCIMVSKSSVRVAYYDIPFLLGAGHGDVAGDIATEYRAVVCRRKVVPVVAGGGLAAAHRVVERAEVGDLHLVPRSAGDEPLLLLAVHLVVLVPLEGHGRKVVLVAAVKRGRHVVDRRVEHLVGDVVQGELCAGGLAEACAVIDGGAACEYPCRGGFRGAGHFAVGVALPHLIINADVDDVAARCLVGAARGLYAVHLVVKLNYVREYELVFGRPRARVLVQVYKTFDVHSIFIVAVYLPVGERDAHPVFVHERPAAPVGVSPAGLVVVGAALDVAAREVPPRHLRAAALVQRIQVDVVAADKLILTRVGVAGGEPDYLHVVVPGAPLLGERVNVGESPAEDVGGGVGVPVVGGALLDISLEASDRGREVVDGGLTVLELYVAVAAYDGPYAGYALAGAQRGGRGRLEVAVVVVVAAVGAVGRV